MREIEVSAKTLENAIDKALAELNVDMDQIECEVLDSGSRGIFGFGQRDAKIKVKVVNEAVKGSNGEAAKTFAEKRQVSPAPAPVFQPQTVKEVKTAKNETAGRPAQAQQAAPAKNEENSRTEPFKKTNGAKTEKPGASKGNNFAAKKSAPRERKLYIGNYNREEAVAQAVTFLQPIFDSLQLPLEYRVEDKEGVLWLIFSGQGLGPVIGHRGETLDALQYLTNLKVNLGRERENKACIVLDVDGYRDSRAQTLVALAHKMADKARRSGRDVVMEPMSPHERRIIHIALQNENGIKTYSLGEEPYRKVVICKK